MLSKGTCDVEHVVKAGAHRGVTPMATVAERTREFRHVHRAELLALAERRGGAGRNGNGAPRESLESVAPSLTGLALSGGGMRSACFNLGLVEALDGRELLPRFDYLSTVSGGSYVGGYLVTCMESTGTGGTNARRARNTLGEMKFSGNTLPKWLWVVGYWFLGFVFQLVKTGSLLIVLLGLLAMWFRSCDSAAIMGLCDVIGLDNDVTRGFVPFWFALAVALAAYITRESPERSSYLVGVSVFLLGNLALSSSVWYSVGDPLKPQTSFLILRCFICILYVVQAWLVWNLRAFQRLSRATKGFMTAFLLVTLVVTLLHCPSTLRFNTSWYGLELAWVLEAHFVYTVAALLALAMSLVIGIVQEREGHAFAGHQPACEAVASERCDTPDGEVCRADAGPPAQETAAPRPPAAEGSAPLLRGLLVTPIVVGLVCFAGLVTTGDIDLNPLSAASGAAAASAASPTLDVNRAASAIYGIACSLLAVASLGFIKWRNVLRSAREVHERGARGPRRTIYQVVEFLTSYGFLLLVIFVLYGFLAREDISGFNAERASIPEEAFVPNDYIDHERFWDRVRELASRDPQTLMWPLADYLNKHRPADPADAGQEERLRALLARPWYERVVRLGLISRAYAEHLDGRRVTEAQALNLGDSVLSHEKLYLDYARAPIQAAIKSKTDAIAAIVAKGRAADIERSELNRLKGLVARAERLELELSKGAVVALRSTPEYEAELRNTNRELLAELFKDELRDRKQVFARIVWAEDQWARFWTISVAFAVWLACCRLVSINKMSLHGFYSDHLRSTWLTSGRERQPGEAWIHETGWVYDSTEARDKTAGSLARKKAPLVLINATVGGDKAMGVSPESPNHLFTFTPLSAGSDETGYWLKGDTEPGYASLEAFLSDKDRIGQPQRKPRTDPRGNELDLSEMIAISGAAISPGEIDNPALSRILNLLNIRTARWISKPKESTRFENLERLRFHFLQSLFIDDPKDGDYFLSDGAHLDNLGLESLLRRRCRLIVVSDCGLRDSSGNPYAVLCEVLRRSRNTFKATIGPFRSFETFRSEYNDLARPDRPLPELFRKHANEGWSLLETQAPAVQAVRTDVKSAAKHPSAGNGQPSKFRGQAVGACEHALARAHFVVAWIDYEPDESHLRQLGILIYVRPTLTTECPDWLLRPGEFSVGFPEDETVDQFYTISRMQAYRVLGRHVGDKLAADLESLRSADPTDVAGIVRSLDRAATARSRSASGTACESISSSRRRGSRLRLPRRPGNV